MDEITDLLPEQMSFRLRPRETNYGYSDLYGSMQLACRYTGKKYNDSLFNFFWNHGCAPPWQNLHPVAITFGFQNKKAKYFVAREDQKKLLQNHGFEDVHAIGMPIVYVPQQNIQRKAGSLLIMPPHILKSTEAQSSSQEEDYMNSIKDQLGSFNDVYACVSPICLEKGMWTKTFEKYGIKILSGASQNDSFALNRMAGLFSFFETVTSPSFGSHIPYALYFGSKVSIWGHYQEAKKDYSRDATWRQIPEIAQKFLDPKWRKEQEQAVFSKHYVPPKQAVYDKDLGAQFLGADHKRSPEELNALFGWNTMKMALIKTKTYYTRAINSRWGKRIVSYLPGE